MKASTALIAIVVVFGGYRYAEERRKLQRAKNTLPPAPTPKPLPTSQNKKMLTFPKIVNVEPGATENDKAPEPPNDDEKIDAGA